MIEYLIFFSSVLVTGLLGFLNPVRAWWRSFLGRGGSSAVVVLAFTVPFLGGQGGPDPNNVLGTIGPIRWLRLGALGVLLLISGVGLLRRLRSFRLIGGAAWWMLLYSLLAMLSALYSVNPMVSALKGFEVFVLVMFGVYLSSRLRTFVDVRWLVDVLALITLSLVISSLVGVLVLPSESLTPFSGVVVIAGVAPVINPNTLTQFAALIAAMCLVYTAQRGVGRGGPTNWIIFSIAIFTVVLAHSRTSILALALAIFAVLYLSGRRLMAIIAMAGGIVAWFATNTLATYIFRGQSQELFLDLSGRLEFWQSTWQLVAEAPIIGHGFYAVQRVLLQISTVDNTYLEVLLGLGFLGVVAFVMPIAISGLGLLTSMPRLHESRNYRILWLELMALFIILFVRSLTGPSFQVMHPSLVMFMVLIISIGAIRRFRVGSQVRTSEPRTWRLNQKIPRHRTGDLPGDLRTS